MPDIAPVTKNELSQRRRQLRKQRRNRLLQTSWRSVAVLGLAAGTVWVVIQPNWVIRRAEQVKIEGNRFLATQSIRSLLPIQYPQSLLRIQSSQISEALTSKAPIAEAIVERHLFPPGLVIKVREREPVAQAIYGSGGKPSNATLLKDSKETKPGEAKPNEAKSEVKSEAKSNEAKTKEAKPGEKSDSKSVENAKPDAFLDENGMLLPLDSYSELNQGIRLPDLKVIGNPDTYKNQWSTFYPIVRRSPIKIQLIDWQNPANLRLKTEIGWVNLGPLSRNFALQVRSLDKMRQLPKRLPPEQIDFLDLRNPNNPTIQLKNGKTSQPKPADEASSPP
jgi:cell division protein FtsQ